MNRRQFGLGLVAAGVALAAPSIVLADDRYWLYSTKKIMLGAEPWKDGWSPCQLGYLFDGDHFIEKMAITLGSKDGSRCIGYTCNIKRNNHDVPLTLFVGPGALELNKVRLSEPLSKPFDSRYGRNWMFGPGNEIYLSGSKRFDVSFPDKLELSQDIRSSFGNSPLIKQRPLSLYLI